MAFLAVIARRTSTTAASLFEVATRLAAGMRKARTEYSDDAGNDGAEKRKQDDKVKHPQVQPFIMLTSSTAIDPRLR